MHAMMLTHPELRQQPLYEGCEPSRPSALHDSLLHLNKPQHGKGDVLLAHQHDLVNMPPAEGERIDAHPRHQETVGKGWASTHGHLQPAAAVVVGG